MARKTDPGPRIDEALLEMAQDGLLSKRLADKITMRVLGAQGAPRPTVLTPEEIRKVRERANMSQAVFARLLNTSLSTVQKWEIGQKKPTGTALKLLHLVQKRGLEVVT